MRALVLDGGHAPSPLAAIRELGEAGWTVGVGAPSESGFSVASRWCRRFHAVPSPVSGIDAFVDRVNRAVADGGYEVLFPSGDAEALALAYAADRIDARVPYADYASLKPSFDKLALAGAAEAAGLAVPSTEPASDAALDRFTPPVMVKSRFHWEPGRGQDSARMEARMAPSRQAARKHAEEIRDRDGDPLYQESLEGCLMGFTVLTDTRSEVVARLQQMAPSTWRPRLGMPARAHTVPVDPELARGVERMLRGLRWFGLVQLQFMVVEGERPRLIDFNGRAYASEALALRAGLNLHDLWGRIATDRPWAPPGPAGIGWRYQWGEGDVRRCLAIDGGGRGSALLGCLGYALGATHPVWRLSDPGPMARYPADLARRLRRRREAQPPAPQPVG